MKRAEQLVRQGEQTLLGLARTYRRCWGDACRHDGLDPDAVFAAFSAGNPFVPYLDRLLQQYQEALGAFEAWGYVGLSISQR